MTLRLPLGMGPAGPKGDPGPMGIQGPPGAPGLSVLPVGFVLPFAGAEPPEGFLRCDGAAVSRSAYADLFAVVGTVYGAGDGATTFNVPDLRGRVVLGTGQGSKLTARALGAKGGEETHVLTLAEMPSHAHGVTDYAGVNTTSPRINSQVGFGEAGRVTSAVGGGQAHNTLPPFLGLTFLIKA